MAWSLVWDGVSRVIGQSGEAVEGRFVGPDEAEGEWAEAMFAVCGGGGGR